MPAVNAPVQKPLNLIMPIKENEASKLLGLLKTLGEENQVNPALEKLGNVHFAQFVFLGDQLAVLTIYDGSFDEYILSFVEHIGDVFDQILKHIKGAPEKSVREDRQAFLDFIRAHDVPTLGLFSAYPSSRVFDVKDAEDAKKVAAGVK